MPGSAGSSTNRILSISLNQKLSRHVIKAYPHLCARVSQAIYLGKVVLLPANAADDLFVRIIILVSVVQLLGVQQAERLWIASASTDLFLVHLKRVAVLHIELIHC